MTGLENLNARELATYGLHHLSPANQQRYEEAKLLIKRFHRYFDELSDFDEDSLTYLKQTDTTAYLKQRLLLEKANHKTAWYHTQSATLKKFEFWKGLQTLLQNKMDQGEEVKIPLMRVQALAQDYQPHASFAHFPSMALVYLGPQIDALIADRKAILKTLQRRKKRGFKLWRKVIPTIKYQIIENYLNQEIAEQLQWRQALVAAKLARLKEASCRRDVSYGDVIRSTVLVLKECGVIQEKMQTPYTRYDINRTAFLDFNDDIRRYGNSEQKKALSKMFWYHPRKNAIPLEHVEKEGYPMHPVLANVYREYQQSAWKKWLSPYQSFFMRLPRLLIFHIVKINGALDKSMLDARMGIDLAHLEKCRAWRVIQAFESDLKKLLSVLEQEKIGKWLAYFLPYRNQIISQMQELIQERTQAELKRWYLEFSQSVETCLNEALDLPLSEEAEKNIQSVLDEISVKLKSDKEVFQQFRQYATGIENALNVRVGVNAIPQDFEPSSDSEVVLNPIEKMIADAPSYGSQEWRDVTISNKSHLKIMERFIKGEVLSLSELHEWLDSLEKGQAFFIDIYAEDLTNALCQSVERYREKNIFELTDVDFKEYCLQITVYNDIICKLNLNDNQNFKAKYQKILKEFFTFYLEDVERSISLSWFETHKERCIAFENFLKEILPHEPLIESLLDELQSFQGKSYAWVLYKTKINVYFKSGLQQCLYNDASFMTSTETAFIPS